ncbi:MAG: hypothetical protein H6838_11470 [Planctomycetes bacterium]|nr:hypothetical protein [Planctomycetota bacterium]
MRRLSKFVSCAVVMLLSTMAPAQEPAGQAAPIAVPLPHHAGHLAPGPDWTVLTAADFAKESRATDPTEDPARKVVLSTCRTLIARQRAEEHVLLHQPGLRPTQVRLINVHSVELRMTSKELCDPKTIARFRGDFEQALAGPDNTIEFVEERIVDLFADMKSLALTFRTTTGGDSWLLTYYYVPSGERLTYFETVHFPADLDARAQIEALLSTFDGALDPGAAANLLTSMTLGGITGGIAGALIALRRRRRLQLAAERAAANG